MKKRYSLWCKGLDPGAQKRPQETDGVVSLLDDLDDDCGTAKPPAKNKKSIFEERKESVQKNGGHFA